MHKFTIEMFILATVPQQAPKKTHQLILHFSPENLSICINCKSVYNLIPELLSFIDEHTMLNQILQKIGLSEKDAEVYLAALELGTQPASVIAKKAGLKRPTTYLILESLLKRGLVSEYNGSNVKYFTAVSPEYLLNYVEKQRRDLTSHQRELEQFLPQFNSLSNPYSLNPKVRFYEGMEGIERVMNDTLTAQTSLACYVKIDAWFSRQDTRDYITWYGKQRVHAKKIPIRGISVDTAMSRKYLEQDYPEIRDHSMSHFRWLPQDIQDFTNEINVYDNKMAIACLGKNELLGIIIESESIAHTQRAIFESAWRTALPAAWEGKKK